MVTEHLFVYGTLLPGLAPEGLRPLLARTRSVGRGSLPGRLYDLGPYPAAVPDAATDTRILGEVLELPDAATILPALDAYEGFDPAAVEESLFVRRRHAVTLADGRLLDCWVYVYNRDPIGAVVIAHGDYRRL
jgi:gamma-glutamylcyclotransferase (GGCT)/AIG2-like uncharacterized protein YtfP